MNSDFSTVSRRAFSASAAAATIVGPRLLRAETAEQKKVGFALVGVGSLTMGQLLPAFAQCKTAQPVAPVSGHPDKARDQAQKYGIDPKNIYNYENFDSIRDNPAVDIVYVVLPNSMHAEYTIRAAKAGKHVLCEKPMATSVADCQAMIGCLQRGAAQADDRISIALRAVDAESHRIGALFRNHQADYRRSWIQHWGSHAMAAEPSVGGRRLADGYRHLRAQCGALSIGTGAE